MVLAQGPLKIEQRESNKRCRVSFNGWIIRCKNRWIELFWIHRLGWPRKIDHGKGVDASPGGHVCILDGKLGQVDWGKVNKV